MEMTIINNGQRLVKIRHIQDTYKSCHACSNTNGWGNWNNKFCL